jgi:hypothetical protein
MQRAILAFSFNFNDEPAAARKVTLEPGVHPEFDCEN